MTNLTEKWDKGELPDGWYYVKDKRDIIRIDYFADIWDYTDVDEVNEVLDEVPTFEQWQKHRKTLLKTQEKNCDLEIINTQLKERNDGLNNRDINLCRIANGIRDENFALKELLKGAKEIIEWYKADCGYRDIPTEVTLQHINQVLGEE